MKPVSYNPEKRTQEGFCAQEFHRVLLSFICTLKTIKNKQNNYYIWEQSDKLVIFCVVCHLIKNINISYI